MVTRDVTKLKESYFYSSKRCRRQIGYVTSAMWSPVVKANIALALIKTAHLKGEIWAEIYFERETAPKQQGCQMHHPEKAVLGTTAGTGYTATRLLMKDGLSEKSQQKKIRHYLPDNQ